MRYCCAVCFFVWLACAVWAPQPVGAQPVRTGERHAVPEWDRQALRAVYRTDGPVAAATMRGVDAASYPLFFGGVPAAWGVALLRDAGYAEAYRLTLSEGVALGAALGLKRVFGRPRPYRTVRGIQSRSRWYGQGRERRFDSSFPSGHATTSFALAASWSFSYPRSYVVAPAFVGAALISVSRLWLGVHYPSDVLVGALLGTATALGVHLLRGAITPDALEGPGASPPAVRLRLALP